jgi:eukaryotic-like serine/threonine-protein kinase
MSLLGTSIGHIRILGELGRGGMGEVYVGVDDRLQRRVALKAIRAEYRLDPGARARFLREARMLSQLEDPHICRIYDYIEGTDADFLVLELIEGRTLSAEAIRGLNHAARLAVALQVAGVLAKAHERGIVHRDLKPGNIMLTGPATIKVLDFGIARPITAAGNQGTGPEHASPSIASLWIDGEAETAASMASPHSDTPPPCSDTLLTEHGVVTGSAAYMSPEQARGEQVTTASDMYTCGLVLQELFTGRPPQPLDLPARELRARAARAESLAPEGIDADVRALIQRLKQAAPASRPTAVEAAERLRWIRDKPKRRLRRLMAAAALVLVSLGVLKYTLDLRAARGEAERRRGQAEDLIGFMLGDLREKLTPVGRLEILDEVGAKALAYFDSLPREAQSDDELMRRARALSQIGEVRLAKGDAAGAIQALDESLALSLRGVERQPQRTDWLATLGATHFWIGYAHWQTNDLEAALDRFNAYRASAKRMVQLEPGRAEWQMELAQAESNLGSVRQAQGRLSDAAQHFESAATIKRSLADAEPGNTRWQQELATTVSWLGENAYRRGHTQEALRHYRDSSALLVRLTDAEPANTQWRFLRAISHTHIARMLHHLGRPDEALAEDRQSRDLMLSLVAHDPVNAEWKRDLAVAHFSVAVQLLALDRPAEALASAAHARGLLSALVADDEGNADWRRALAWAENVTAAAEFTSRNYATALAAVKRGRATLEPLQHGAADPAAARHRAQNYLLEGAVLDALGQRGRAHDAWVNALGAIEPAAHESTRADLLWPRAQALVRLARQDEAKPVFAALAAQEFRPIELARFCRQYRCE